MSGCAVAGFIVGVVLVLMITGALLSIWFLISK